MPEHRISPAEQMRQSLEQFLSGGLTSEGEPTSTLVRLAARVVLQEALTDAGGECLLGRSAVSELTDRLGRVHLIPLGPPRGATWAILAQSSGPRARVV
jgi:hypothetical protein